MTDRDTRTMTPQEVVELTGCDREAIHLLGGIQPIGFLVATTGDWVVRRGSANLAAHLGQGFEALRGGSLAELLLPQALRQIAGRLHLLCSTNAVERLFGVVLTEGGVPYDIAIHLQAGDSRDEDSRDRLIVLEGELTDLEDPLETGPTVRDMIARLHQAEGFDGLCREAVRQIRAITGFDRVMLYRFDPDGAGEVIAESVADCLGSFMGHHFPASDIPRQARILYEKNLLRLIADVRSVPVPVLPLPLAGQAPLDLSLSVLRSVSPIHVEYLCHMGVRASMSISVLRKGRLWGLIACHHNDALRVSFERRTVSELFGQIFSMVLESRERAEELAQEARANGVHTRLMASLGAMKPGSSSLAESLALLAEVIPCDGIALWSSGAVSTHGHTPTSAEIAVTIPFLHGAASGSVFATHCLGQRHAPGRDFVDRAAGLLAIPLSRAPRDYLVFFRREVTQNIIWAGDPNKPMTPGPDGPRLTPRLSFAAWKQTVQGQSQRWSEGDMIMAERLRITLLEVVLQLTDMADRERRVSQERQEILIAELNHRVRNILALIRGLVSQSRDSAGTVEEFAALIGGRIQALARAHDQITTDRFQPAPLAELVLAEAAAYLQEGHERVRLSGPPALLEPQAHTTIALVIHEMMTNAAKYGALSSSHGRVVVSWRFDEEEALEMLWREEGGPPVQLPARKGFGTTIIERAVPHDLKGEATLRYSPFGVEARILIPARYVQVDPAGGPGTTAGDTPGSDGGGGDGDGGDGRGPRRVAKPLPEAEFRLSGRVLLVEDNLLIAMDAEDQLRRMGADPVDVAATSQAALLLLEEAAPTVALLDVNLGRENSFPVADALAARGIPYVFATGYGEASAFPERFRSATIISKPYTLAEIRKALQDRLA